MDQDARRHPDLEAPDLAGVVRPISGGSAAITPLAIALAPLIIEEVPKIIGSLFTLINLVRSHPDTPEAQQQQLATVLAHLDATKAAVAAVEI